MKINYEFHEKLINVRYNFLIHEKIAKIILFYKYTLINWHCRVWEEIDKQWLREERTAAWETRDRLFGDRVFARRVGMFDSDSILEKIDSFGRRIGILNRFFAIRFSLEPILNGQNRNRNGPTIKRFRILKLMTFFFLETRFFTNASTRFLTLRVLTRLA